MPPEIISRWLDHLRFNAGLSHCTVDKYKLYSQRLSDFLADRGSDLLHATTDDLIAFTGPHAHAQGMRQRSRRVLVSACKSFYKFASARQIMSYNPANGLPHPKFGATLPRKLEMQHAQSLIMQPDLSTLAGCRDAAILSVLLDVGPRVSGITALNQNDLSFIPDPKRNIERLVIKFREKGNIERLTPVTLDTQLFIRAYLGHAELGEIDRDLDHGDKVLFVNFRNSNVPRCDHRGEARRLNRRAIVEIMRKHGRAAGIPDHLCHPHAARHLVGTELYEATGDVKATAAVLGHRDLKNTQLYAQMAIRRQADTQDKASVMSQIKSPMALMRERLGK